MKKRKIKLKPGLSWGYGGSVGVTVEKNEDNEKD